MTAFVTKNPETLVMDTSDSDRLVPVGTSRYPVICALCGKITFSNNLKSFVPFGRRPLNSIFKKPDENPIAELFTRVLDFNVLDLDIKAKYCPTCLRSVQHVDMIKQTLRTGQQLMNEVESSTARRQTLTTKTVSSERTSSSNNAPSKPIYVTQEEEPDSEEGEAKPEHSYCRLETFKQEMERNVSKSILFEENHEDGEMIKTLDSACERLCSRDRPSILRMKTNLKSLQDSDFLGKVVKEMQESIPVLFNVFKTVAVPVGSIKCKDSVLTTMAIAYGMLMFCRNKDLCGIQKLLTSMVLHFNGGNIMLDILNKASLTYSSANKINFLDQVGQLNTDAVVNKLRKSVEEQPNTDHTDVEEQPNTDHTDVEEQPNTDHTDVEEQPNTDHTVGEEQPNTDHTVGEEQPNTDHTVGEEQPNTDHNDVEEQPTPTDRGEKRKLENLCPSSAVHPYSEILQRFPLTPGGDITKIDYKFFYLNSEQETSLKAAYDVHVARLLKDHCSSLKWFCPPVHIQHSMDDIVQEISNGSLSGLNFDTSQYLPLGEVQPTKATSVEVKSQKKSPVSMELFHALQDFLEKTFKSLCDQKTADTVGTMANMKVLLDCKNVCGKVKVKYESHLNFVMTITEALILEYSLKYLGMETLDSDPTTVEIPEDIRQQNPSDRQKVMNDVVSKIVDEMFESFSPPLDPHPINCMVKSAGQPIRIQLQSEQFEKGPVKLKVIGPGGQPTIKTIPVPDHLKKKTIPRDDMYNYNRRLLQWGMHIIDFLDMMRERDIDRLKINLRRMIAFFYAWSPTSRYLTECLDYIVKTEVLLPQRMALCIMLASLFNAENGKRAAYKSVESQLENIKKIKGVMACRTTKSLNRETAAASVLADTVSTLQEQILSKPSSDSYTNKSRTKDVVQLLKHLREHEICTIHEGRCLKIRKYALQSI